MRVLFVTPYYYPEYKFGGPPKRLHAMACALSGTPQRVRVVTVDSELPRRTGSAELDGIPVQYLPWLGNPLYAIPTQPRLLADAIRVSDIVHCFGLYNIVCPLAAWLTSRYSKPFVLEPMGMYAPKVRTLALKRFYNATVTCWMAKRAAAVIATSEIERVELQPLERLTQVVVRGNGINVEDFAALPSRSIMRERWCVKPDEKVVLYLGRVSEKKQLRELIAAFLRFDQADTKLVIVGPVSEPGYAEQLKRDIERSSKRKDIILAPAMYGDDLKAALSAADLFVLPSLNENFGNAAGEAVAAGVPVLLTEICGIAPLIHRRAGLAVPLGVESLAAGMRMMLDPEISAQMTARREEVKDELSWDEPVARTIALYEKIIRNADCE